LTGKLEIPHLYENSPEYETAENKKVVLHELIHVITSRFLYQYIREHGWLTDIYGSEYKDEIVSSKLT